MSAPVRAVLAARIAQVEVLVGRGGHVDHPTSRRVVHGAAQRLVDDVLAALARAGQQPRVDEVAVVGDRHLLGRRPHQAAHRVLGVDVAVVVDDLDRRDPHAGCDAGDALAVVGRRDDARDVRAVLGGGRHPGAPAPVRLAAQATGGGVRVQRLGEVGVTGVDARVQHADHDVLAAPGDLVGRSGADLGHVPLVGRPVRGAHGARVRGHGDFARSVSSALRLLSPLSSRAPRSRAVRAVEADPLGERLVGGRRDRHRDLRVEHRGRTAGFLDRGLRVALVGALVEHHQVPQHV